MKIKELVLFFIILISIEIRAQESYYMPATDDIVSLVCKKNHPITKYIVRNIKYSVYAQNKGICGTYIGCIRIKPNGDLLDVFTINSLESSLDNQFVDMIKNACQSKEIEFKAQTDTTDIVVPISYKFSWSVEQEPYYYYVDKELAPKNMIEEVRVVSYWGAKISRLKSDSELVSRANKKFKQEKFKQCVRSLDELIRRNPYSADLLYMRAKAYIFLKKEDKVLRDYYYIKNFLKNDKYKSLESSILTAMPNRKL